MDTLIPTFDSPVADGDAAYHSRLGAFCRRVGEIIDSAPATEIPTRIAALLQPLLATPNLLTPEQRAVPPQGYGRHDVFICPDEGFSVLAAVWPAGIVSPIHDHLTWCALGVLEGVIRETRYAPGRAAADHGAAAPVSVTDLMAGDVVHLPVGAPDIHSMHNPTGEPAISIHVYAGDAGKLGPMSKISTPPRLDATPRFARLWAERPIR